MEPLIKPADHSGQYLILVGEDDNTLQAPQKEDIVKFKSADDKLTLLPSRQKSASQR